MSAHRFEVGRRRMTESNTAGDRLYNEILSAIISGEYTEGTRLPPEKDLCEKFEMSRPMVREALARLRSEGVIRSRKGSGSYVIKRAVIPPSPPSGVGSIAEIEECYDFRIALEGENAAYAAARRTDEDLSEMSRLFEVWRGGIQFQTGGIVEDYNLHLAIARATHNQFCVYSFMALEQHILFSIGFIRRMTAFPVKNRRKSLAAEHEAILNAISEGNENKARKAMRRHIENSKIRIFEGRDV